MISIGRTVLKSSPAESKNNRCRDIFVVAKLSRRKKEEVMRAKYDVILKGGKIMDPSQNLHGERDVAFKDGTVAALGTELPWDEGVEIIDVTDRLVVPGLIDLHGHFNYKMTAFHADADEECLPFGVTTAVDTGSTGWINFPAFRSYVMEKIETRLYAFIHLSSFGTMPVVIQVPDLGDFRFARMEETIQCIEDNRDVVLGVKVRLSPTGTTLENAVPALKMVRQIADRTNTLVMVHVMESPIPLAQVFEYLKPGDIVTHIFHGDTHNILDGNGQVRPEVWEASKAGIIFDTAGAMRHFSIPICRAAVDQKLFPHVISTDRVGPRPGRVNYSLLDHMSIFLALGMSIEEVIQSVTCNAAVAMGRQCLGNFSLGSLADAAVLEIEDGNFTFEDQLGNQLQTSQRFRHIMTVKGGKLWERKRE